MGRKRKAWLYGGDGRRPGCTGYTVVWNQYPAGKRKSKSHTFESLELATDFIRRHNARVDLGLIGCMPDITVDEAVDEFVAGCSALSERTADEYATSLALLRRGVGNKLIREISGADIDQFIAGRFTGREKTTGEIVRRSGATVQKHIRNVSRFFTWAIRRKYLIDNPIDAATTRPRGRFKRQRPVITEEQLAAFIAALDDDRRLAVWIGMTTGLDRGVINWLRWDQVDLEAGFIHVTRPKTRKRLILPIHNSLNSLLRQRRDGTCSSSDRVFARISRQNNRKDWWQAARTAANLPDGFVFRDLRAIATRRVIDAGGDLRDAADLLGHQSISTTSDHYYVARPSLVSAVRRSSLPGFPSAPTATAPSPASAASPPSE